MVDRGSGRVRGRAHPEVAAVLSAIETGLDGGTLRVHRGRWLRGSRGWGDAGFFMVMPRYPHITAFESLIRQPLVVKW